VAQAVAQANRGDDSLEPCLVGPGASQRRRKDDVLEGVEGRHQVESLEDESDAVAPEHGELPVAQPAQFGAADEDLPAGDGLEPRERVHERRFARS